MFVVFLKENPYFLGLGDPYITSFIKGYTFTSFDLLRYLLRVIFNFFKLQKYSIKIKYLF